MTTASERPRRRVLVVPPMYGGSLPVARYAAAALRRLGHGVDTFEAPAFHSAFTALGDLRVTADRLEYLENAFLQVIGQAILAKVETFEPDLVLALAQAPLGRQALRRLRKDGVPTAMWFVEDYRLFTYWEAYAPHYDFFAVIQKEPFLSRLAEIGQPNALYLPMAADPLFHRPLELSAVERRKYGADVAFLGAGYPNRRLAFRELTGFDFKIWGSDWDGDAVLAPRLQLGGRRITSEEAVTIFNATAVNLNLHSSVKADKLVPGGDFVNPRTFELAMCGAFQLVDRRDLMAECFAPDELAVFDDLAGLKEAIGHYLAHPEERRALADKARTRALSEHAYDARMAALLDFVAARRPGFGTRRRDSGSLDILPPETRTEVAALLQELGLPSDVGFADLIQALRARQGKLTPLETTILFLDEWRKQYAGG